MKKILLIVAASAVALIALTGLAWGATNTLSKKQSETHAAPAGVRSVVVDVGTGDVSLVHGTGGVSVRDVRHWALRKPTVTQSVRDGVLTVKARCHGGFPFGSCATNVRVALPDGMPVKVRTDVGDVSGRELVTRDVDARTHVGDVRLSLAQQPDRLDATSDVGDVRLDVPRSTYAVDSDADVGERDVSGLVQDDGAARKIHAFTNVGDVGVQGH